MLAISLDEEEWQQNARHQLQLRRLKANSCNCFCFKLTVTPVCIITSELNSTC